MSKANSTALKTLAAGKYMLVPTAISERQGANPDRTTGEASMYVNVRFETQNRQYVYQNYSLNNPRALRNLLVAITGSSEEADYLLETIDWAEPADVEQLFNKPVVAEVTVRKYTDRNGNEQVSNEVANVEHPKPLPVA